MVKGQAAVSIVLRAFLLFALYILQSLVFPHFRILGAAPMLLPLAVVGVSMFEGASRRGGFALCAGILCDISFNQPTIMFTVILTVIGIIVGFLAETVLAHGFLSFLALCAAVLVVLVSVQMSPLFFFSNTARRVLLEAAGLQILYSLVFVPILYFPVRGLGKIMSA